ncbi:MAG: Cro/CI family transcriptional regulator [Leptospirales bacterium]
MTDPKPSEPVSRAVAIVGGQSALARELGVSQTTVWKWLNGIRKVPGPRALEIERMTGGQVTAEELRPSRERGEAPGVGEVLALPADVLVRLESLSKTTGHPVTYLIREAILQYLKDDNPA